MLFGASWQPPRKMSKKCLESVWKVSWCWGWCWKNVQKMSKRCPPDIFQTVWTLFGQKGTKKELARGELENQKGGGPREARAPPCGWRPKAATSIRHYFWGDARE